MPAVKAAVVASAATGASYVVYIMPTSASLAPGQSAFFNASVSGAPSAAVSWSVSPAIGTITNGYYVAPSTVASAQTVTVTATSIVDPTKSASAPVFLSAGTSGSGSTGAAPTTTSGTMQVSPSSVSVTPGQSTQFSVSTTGGLAAAASWSLVPNVGSIANGVYTAPSSVSTQTAVTLIATNVSDPTKTASAAITIQPSVVSAVSVSVSPSTASLTSSQIAQFSATVNGAASSGVTWSVSPAVGSIANGAYTAPASIAASQTVTVTATSQADPTKSASAAVTLVPVSIGLSPATISLAPSKSAQFMATVTGASNTSVTWSITPSVGSVSNGLYLAPSTVSAAQTVTLTATSVADATKTAQATISLTPSASSPLTVSPSQISLTASQSQQFSAASSGGIGGSGPVTAQWSISPSVGTISQSGVYTAPSTISAAQTVTVTATGSAGIGTATVTLSASPSPAGTILLPVEVMGSAGTTVPVSFNIASGANLSGQQQLWLQVHGLKYETEASVQANGGAWIPINTSTVTFQDQAGLYGGIGGGFATLKVTLTLPAGSITSGTNTLNFRFNGSDGITSGFRVINLNVLAADGSQLIPSTSFTSDDPATWQPPLNTTADIQAGQTLWKTASLTTPNGPILAHCSDCHTQDGRDLKYFNYSNLSIRARGMFHGLSQQQSDQIASYIRSLNVPAPSSARPWNPPYQPGPGLDSQPVQNWSAGAGVDAVLGSESDMVSHLMPGGSTAGWLPTASLNQRELPVAMQLLDWNRWLPTTHPMDSLGTAFTSGQLMSMYQQIRSVLTYQNPTSYKAAAAIMDYWIANQLTFQGQVLKGQTDPAWTNPAYTRAAYSLGLWAAVKFWEINQEFGLEAIPQAVWGPNADVRAWYKNPLFFVSPNMMHIPSSAAGLGNGQPVMFTYLSMMWYQTELIVNDGNGTGPTAEDFPYVYNFIGAMGYGASGASPQSHNGPGHAALMLEWLIKALQASQFVGGPDLGSAGWQPSFNAPYVMATFPNSPTLWNGFSPSQQSSMINGYLNIWFAKIKSFTPQQFYTGGWASPTEVINDGTPQGSIGDGMANSLFNFLYLGADPNLVSQIGAWAQTVWPTFNWQSVAAPSCSLSIASGGWVTCN